jgi:hypothetical protein
VKQEDKHTETIVDDKLETDLAPIQAVLETQEN